MQNQQAKRTLNIYVKIKPCMYFLEIKHYILWSLKDVV